MSAHARLRRSAAVAFVSAITAGSALLLTACDPSDADAAKAGTATPSRTAGPSHTATGSATPAGSASASATPTTAATPTASAPAQQPSASASAPARQPSAEPTKAALNLTKGTGLTISNGTRYVVMDGKVVDFGTVVRDLAWSPDGKHAAFVDGNGNLETSDPDGGHKVLVATAPAGVTWSHPTWQVYTPTAEDQSYGVPAKNNLFFTADDHGTLRLLGVPATGGTPAPIRLGTYADENPVPNPATGNLWPNVGTRNGTAVYANKGDGQVYLRDDYLRQNGGPVTKGSQPDLDDEGDIVFVRSVDGHSHLFTKDRDDRSAERDLTPHATVDYTEPAFSPDGRTIAFRAPDGIYTLPAKGGTPTKVSDTVGLPAYRG
ncbi:PD40 domain-containing protein [Kitasatospora sp. NA04385]|uniref:TolB family protein n=1 Tax=Kitasatospora sp. NA04385 TaxID=2742135 RepID=UPI001591082D|nr:PD40 domain-containing protein [Kitasatospora sp. NA04385]QKW20440.1 PD40 domain-containing protein [Kitasatospora sp. NA04385]